MYKRVLVPLDGSEASEAIVPFIAEIAGPLDADVLLLFVHQPPSRLELDGPLSPTQFADAARGVAKDHLAAQAARMVANGLRVHIRVRSGRPVDEILAAAREEGADMIAMTTHGRTGPGRLLFGSVAEGVLRQAEVPVFLMRQTERSLA